MNKSADFTRKDERKKKFYSEKFSCVRSTSLSTTSFVAVPVEENFIVNLSSTTCTSLVLRKLLTQFLMTFVAPRDGGNFNDESLIVFEFVLLKQTVD